MTEWYYCADCKTHFQDKKRIKECRSFGHKIKRRTPIQQRIVHQTSGEYFFTLNIEQKIWKITADILLFKENPPTPFSPKEKWHYYASAVLNPPLNEMAKKLSHLNPENPITTEELEKLFIDSITKGKYEEKGTRTAKLYVCLDTDLQLTPKNQNSRWVCTTKATIRNLQRSDSEILEEAQKTAQPMR